MSQKLQQKCQSLMPQTKFGNVGPYKNVGRPYTASVPTTPLLVYESHRLLEVNALVRNSSTHFNFFQKFCLVNSCPLLILKIEYHDKCYNHLKQMVKRGDIYHLSYQMEANMNVISKIQMLIAIWNMLKHKKQARLLETSHLRHRSWRKWPTWYGTLTCSFSPTFTFTGFKRWRGNTIFASSANLKQQRHWLTIVQFSLYSVSVLLSESHEWSAPSSPLAWAVGHAAAFAVNAAPTPSHSVAREPFPTPSTMLDRLQVPFFKSSVWPDRNRTPLTSFRGVCSTKCTT